MEAAPPPMEINWVPPINPSEGDSEPSDGATVMPLFPLGVTYLPFTQNTLNIFEPRYRQMYNDILFSGARRFMVCNVDQETGRLAETGVIFYLDELKEVSEQTQDRVKYIGQHSVKGRVQLKKVLNPSVAATRETYLKAEVVELVDTDADESTESEEAGLRELRQGVNNEAGASHGGANGDGTKWRVLVAHERSLRGLDMPSLKTVVLTMMPDTPEDYIHLAGRTGRAGGAAKGRAVSVFTPREFDQAGRLTRALRDVQWEVRRDG